jgi:hypothetical protein
MDVLMAFLGMPPATAVAVLGPEPGTSRWRSQIVGGLRGLFEDGALRAREPEYVTAAARSAHGTRAHDTCCHRAAALARSGHARHGRRDSVQRR